MFYPEGWSESERERERSPEQADRKSRAREAREDFIYAIGDINAEWDKNKRAKKGLRPKSALRVVTPGASDDPVGATRCAMFAALGGDDPVRARRWPRLAASGKKRTIVRFF